jgi:membrane protease YdiL (CAAX protease family)
MGAIFDATIMYIAATLIAGIVLSIVPVGIYSRLFGPLLRDEIQWAVYVANWTVWIGAMLGLLVAGSTSREVLDEIFPFPAIRKINRNLLLQSLVIFSLVVGLDMLGAYWFPQQIYQDIEFWNYILTSKFKWLMLFNLLFLGPLFEEAMFRGLLYPAVSLSFLGPVGSAAITSAIWAAIHFYSLPMSICIFLSGFALCYLRQISGNLWPSFLLHVALNLFASIEIIYFYNPI